MNIELLKAQGELCARQNELKSLDYQTLKTAEAIIRLHVAQHGTEGLPYSDIVEKLDNRDSIRNRVNELQEIIKEAYKPKE